MEQQDIALMALVATNLALIVGWLVSGTQRVAEELTKDRRTSYSELLCAALAVRNGRAEPSSLAEHVERAEFVSSSQMRESRLIQHLEACVVADEPTWSDARARYMTAARFEAHHNQATRRRLSRSRIYGIPGPDYTAARLKR